jgi:hypothetical protein
MSLRDPDTLAQHYVAMWSEPDPGRRRQIIEELWAPGGAHLLQPPEEVRAEADRLGIVGAGFEAVGHDAIEHRVTTAHEDFVVRQSFTFRLAGDAQRLRNTVMFRWESVHGGEAVGGGTEFLVLDPDDRIVADHMFPG